MTIDKNITVDLNRVQPLKTIQIHEGDTNSVRLVFTLTKDSADVDLSSVSIRYDAVIGDYLAEQDAPGSIEDGKAVVPVTANNTLPPDFREEVRREFSVSLILRRIPQDTFVKESRRQC